MKHFVLLILALIPFLTSAQLLDGLPTDKDGKLAFNYMVVLDGQSKNSLYRSALQYRADTNEKRLKKYDAEDFNAGIVKALRTYEIKIPGVLGSQKWDLVYTLRIDAEEGRYRYSITDVYYIKESTQRVVDVTAEQLFSKQKPINRNGSLGLVMEELKYETLNYFSSHHDIIKAAMEKQLPDTDVVK